MRHRRKGKNAKIKLEHHLIPGLRKLLEELEAWPEIQSIIPGEIKRRGGSQNSLRIRAQYPTLTGVKCLAQSTGAVQEVFFVGSDPEALKRKLEEEFGS